MVALTYRYVALTDVGLRRSNNEDSGYASSRLLAIADGMGGAAAGDLASSAAMNIVRQVDRDLEVDALAALQQAVRQANTRLGELIDADPAVEGMGTTLEAMLWDGQRLAVAHLGDSRMYRLRAGTLTQVSTDHTFVQSLVEEGKLTPVEARVHPHRSLLLRAMLGRDDNQADFTWIEPELGDRYLLCSDGLSDMVPDHLIERALASETIDLAATELVRLALEGGGHDNVTVAISEFVEAGTDPDEHLSSANGQPQLVGAASEQPRPPTGSTAAGHDATGDFDEEELRYAALPPDGRPWLRRSLIGVLVVAVLVAVAWGAYAWTQTQYYVASTDDGFVAVYQGVDTDIPGVSLNHVVERTDIAVDSLRGYDRSQVDDGIAAESRAGADLTVQSLRESTGTDPSTTDTTPTPTSTASSDGDR